MKISKEILYSRPNQRVRLDLRCSCRSELKGRRKKEKRENHGNLSCFLISNSQRERGRKAKRSKKEKERKRERERMMRMKNISQNRRTVWQVIEQRLIKLQFSPRTNHKPGLSQPRRRTNRQTDRQTDGKYKLLKIWWVHSPATMRTLQQQCMQCGQLAWLSSVQFVNSRLRN